MRGPQNSREVIRLDGEEIARLLPMRECMTVMSGALRTLAQGEGILPLRSILSRPDGRALALMPAALGTSGPFGVKILTLNPHSPGGHSEMLQGHVLLFDADRGHLCLIADAMSLTAIRTAAVSGVATESLARRDAQNLSILGTGTEAKTHLEAMLIARPIRRTRVWSRNPEKARQFAAWGKRAFGMDIEVCASAKEAVHEADIICTVTASPEPVLFGSWISPGAHINAVGAFSPRRRELDTDAVIHSRLFVDRRESALHEAGEFCIPQRQGLISESHIQGELGEILAGKIPGRQTEEEITLFKSLGIAVEDVASAVYLIEKATQLGAGTRVVL